MSIIEPEGYVITDSIKLRKQPWEIWPKISTADGLASWWPVGCSISEGEEQAITFTWQNGSSLRSMIQKITADKELQFTFGKERVRLEILALPSGCLCNVTHSGIAPDDLGHIVHIAQSWSFLLCNLKSVLENGIDLRETDVDEDELVNR